MRPHSRFRLCLPSATTPSSNQSLLGRSSSIPVHPISSAPPPPPPIDRSSQPPLPPTDATTIPSPHHAHLQRFIWSPFGPFWSHLVSESREGDEGDDGGGLVHSLVMCVERFSFLVWFLSFGLRVVAICGACGVIRFKGIRGFEGIRGCKGCKRRDAEIQWRHYAFSSPGDILNTSQVLN